MSKIHWVALATEAGIGGKTLTRLFKRFGSLESILEAPTDDLLSVPRVGPATASAISSIDLSAVEADIGRLSQEGIQIFTWEDPAYPANLLRSDDAPPVLFVRGELNVANSRVVAIVGTRQPSHHSAESAYRVALELAKRGWTIASGLAIGIDTAAHQGALAAGRTLAVLGSGVAQVYPRRNVPLAEQIMSNGALLSELHPRTPVSPQNLIARNRIISGLSRAVIVVQGGVDSGSMNTAKRASEQRRLVLAVVGNDAGYASLVDLGAEPIDPDQIHWDALSERLDRIPCVSLPTPADESEVRSL